MHFSDFFISLKFLNEYFYNNSQLIFHEFLEKLLLKKYSYSFFRNSSINYFYYFIPIASEIPSRILSDCYCSICFSEITPMLSVKIMQYDYMYLIWGRWQEYGNYFPKHKCISDRNLRWRIKTEDASFFCRLKSRNIGFFGIKHVPIIEYRFHLIQMETEKTSGFAFNWRNLLNIFIE